MSFHVAGWRKVGQCLFAGWLAALVVYVVALGLPAANGAFMVLIMIHAASVSQRLQPWLSQHRLFAQLAVGLLVFLAVSLFVYAPARQGFERYVATPLPTSAGVVVVNPRAPLASIQRGDWLGYRIAGRYAAGIRVQSGFGFGPVLAVPGDRVEFTANGCQVNGRILPRRAHMPRTGELALGPKQWLVWPEVEVSSHGVGEDVVVAAMLETALVDQADLAGRPYARWFFRKQRVP